MVAATILFFIAILESSDICLCGHKAVLGIDDDGVQMSSPHQSPCPCSSQQPMHNQQCALHGEKLRKSVNWTECLHLWKMLQHSNQLLVPEHCQFLPLRCLRCVAWHSGAPACCAFNVSISELRLLSKICKSIPSGTVSTLPATSTWSIRHGSCVSLTMKHNGEKRILRSGVGTMLQWTP